MRAVHWPAKKDPAAALAVLQEIRDTIGETRTEGAQGYLNPRDANPDDAETHDVPGDEVTSETMAEPAQNGLDEVWPEVLHQIWPSERDICRALGWIEWPRTGRNEPLGWVMCCACGMLSPPEGRSMRPDFDGHLGEIAGMHFYTMPGARKKAEAACLLPTPTLLESSSGPRMSPTSHAAVRGHTGRKRRLRLI